MYLVNIVEPRTTVYTIQNLFIKFFKGLVANESSAPGSKPKITCSTGTVAVTTLHFWISAAFYLYLDLTGKPGFLYK